ncbi:MAG: HNH endonuclease signature motif containing protein [Myxococcota bacterium]
MGEVVSTKGLRGLSKRRLFLNFSALVGREHRDSARVIAYVGEIDRRKLYLEHAYPSMFAFCTEGFRMSESMASKRIRTARAACRFPHVLTMIGRGELHMSGAYQLAPHLSDDNHRELLRRAKHRTMRDIERLIAEFDPKPDAQASVRALPSKRRGGLAAGGSGARTEASRANGTGASSDRGAEQASARALSQRLGDDDGHAIGRRLSEGDGHAIGRRLSEGDGPAVRNEAAGRSGRPSGRATPLSPGRYRLTVTIGEQSRATLEELRGLLSHQIPDGNLSSIVERALELLLEETQKRKAALVKTPRGGPGSNTNGRPKRGIPANVRRKVYERDGGKCAFRDAAGRRCGSKWKVEFHHKVPYAKGGRHTVDNVELRCRAHNQYEAELDFGKDLIAKRRERPR